MALGIVNNDEFERELGRATSEPIVTVVDVNKGRGNNSNEVPDSLRKIIGEEAVINGREDAIKLAEQFGISKSSVSAYTNGSTSTTTYNKQPNLAHLNSARMRVSKIARKKLEKALYKIDDEKLDRCDAVELSTVAKSMSSIVKDMEPESPRDNSNSGVAGPTFIFYAPQLKEEKHYDVVNARE